MATYITDTLKIYKGNRCCIEKIIFVVKFHAITSKGQLISKTDCEAMDSSKKRTNEFVFTSMRRVFVRFLEESLGLTICFRNYLTFSAAQNGQHCPDKVWVSFELLGALYMYISGARSETRWFLCAPIVIGTATVESCVFLAPLEPSHSPVLEFGSLLSIVHCTVWACVCVY